MLYPIFRYCFDSGTVPSEWMENVINPIYKEGSSSVYEPLNYRGITLINVICKPLLHQRMSKCLENCHLLNDAQNGLRHMISCHDHI